MQQDTPILSREEVQAARNLSLFGEHFGSGILAIFMSGQQLKHLRHVNTHVLLQALKITDDYINPDTFKYLDEGFVERLAAGKAPLHFEFERITDRDEFWYNKEVGIGTRKSAMNTSLDLKLLFGARKSHDLDDADGDVGFLSNLRLDSIKRDEGRSHGPLPSVQRHPADDSDRDE